MNADNVIELCIPISNNYYRFKLNLCGKVAVLNTHYDFYHLLDIVHKFIEERPELESLEYEEEKKEIYRKFSGKEHNYSIEGSPIDQLPKGKYENSKGEEDRNGTLDGSLINCNSFLESVLRQKSDSINWGRIFDEQNSLVYEGQVDTKGMASGYGKLFFSNTGVVQYEGHLTDNICEGKGLLYSDSGVQSYYGDFRNGRKKGKGIEYYHTGGKLYEGEWEEDCWSGFGTWYNLIGEIKFRGVFQRGVPVRNKQKGTIDYKNYYLKDKQHKEFSTWEISSKYKTANNTTVKASEDQLSSAKQSEKDRTIKKMPILTELSEESNFNNSHRTAGRSNGRSNRTAGRSNRKKKRSSLHNERASERVKASKPKKKIFTSVDQSNKPWNHSTKVLNPVYEATLYYQDGSNSRNFNSHRGSHDSYANLEKSPNSRKSDYNSHKSKNTNKKSSKKPTKKEKQRSGSNINLEFIDLIKKSKMKLKTKENRLNSYRTNENYSILTTDQDLRNDQNTYDTSTKNYETIITEYDTFGLKSKKDPKGKEVKGRRLGSHHYLKSCEDVEVKIENYDGMEKK